MSSINVSSNIQSSGYQPLFNHKLEVVNNEDHIRHQTIAAEQSHQRTRRAPTQQTTNELIGPVTRTTIVVEDSGFLVSQCIVIFVKLSGRSARRRTTRTGGKFL